MCVRGCGQFFVIFKCLVDCQMRGECSVLFWPYRFYYINSGFCRTVALSDNCVVLYVCCDWICVGGGVVLSLSPLFLHWAVFYWKISPVTCLTHTHTHTLTLTRPHTHTHTQECPCVCVHICVCVCVSQFTSVILFVCWLVVPTCRWNCHPVFVLVAGCHSGKYVHLIICPRYHFPLSDDSSWFLTLRVFSSCIFWDFVFGKMWILLTGLGGLVISENGVRSPVRKVEMSRSEWSETKNHRK